jgi:hypothetical protein
MPRQPFDQRINAWLQENAGEEFTRNKWKFWFLTLCGFQLLNATLTALTFSAGGNLENYMGGIMLAVGALLAWLAVAFMHYSDSTDRRLARGVSLLDSITLICVLAHFTFLLWTFGHLRTLQNAEAKYEMAAATYNAKAEKVSDDNVRIAEAAQTIAKETTKAEKLRNDTAYQNRKAAEAGRGIPLPHWPAQSAPIGSGLATSTVELEKPQKPDESSARFLSRWDFWIRAANLAELLLAAATLIYIRNRSAKTNAPASNLFDKPERFSTASGVRSPAAIPAFDSAKNDHTVWSENDHTDAEKKATRVASPVNEEGLRKLRAVLSRIGFQYGPTHFFSDAKWDKGYVWIRQRKSENGVARTVASMRAKIEILDHALKMDEDKFRAKLERVLRENHFEL